MYYDDVDVNMVDSKDCFGVADINTPPTPKNPFAAGTSIPDRISGKSPIHRTSMKRELNAPSDFKLQQQQQSKFTKKTKADSEQSEKDRVAEPKMATFDPPASDFKYKPATTFKEKLSVLEERDKYLRETTYRGVSKNMNVIVTGTCPDMCPEKERLLREVNCFFSVFEGQIVENEIHVVPEMLVKEYSRSSADQEEPLPHELRPEAVLVDTMSYLLANIVPKIEESSVDVGEWYNFCWDRLRSLRKDIIQQQICSKKIVHLLEQSARFHICCFDRLSDFDRRIFDDKINAENLVNCLQMLMTMYEDLEPSGQLCENESEFRVYMMLLLLDSGDVPDVLRWHSESGRKVVEEAKEIFFAFKLKLYTKFFKLIKKTTYLNACILQRYFVQTRAHTLNVLLNAYSSGSHMARFPMPFVQKVLELNTDEETASFVESYALKVNFEMEEVVGSKSSFTPPDIKPTCKSSYILQHKRLPILQAVTGVANYVAERTATKVHSSFDEDEVLKADAWLAEDQRQKVVQLYGDIYTVTPEEAAQDEDEMEEHEPEVPPFSPDKQEVCKVLPPVLNFLPPVMTTFNFGSYEKLRDDTRSAMDMVDFKTIEFPKPEPTAPTSFFSFAKPLMKPPPEPLKSPLRPPVPSPTRYVAPPIVSPLLEEPCAVEAETDEVRTAEDEEMTHRKSEEVVEDLTNALTQFEQVYWSHFGVTKEDQIALQRQKLLKENRRLRRIVKHRLKRQNAKKVARMWRKKVEVRKKKGENFVGIVHLPPEEYFRLWGVVRRDDDFSNIVKEMTDARKTAKWSSGLLNSESINIRYIGDKVARLVLAGVRSQRAESHFTKSSSMVCLKLLVSVPYSQHPTHRCFVSKVGEMCRTLFYENENSKLGSVQDTTLNGVRVLTAVDVNASPVQQEDVTGVSNLIAYINEHWESAEECVERVSAICSELVYAVHVSLIVAGECIYKQQLVHLMTDLHHHKLITGWSITRWSNFFSLPKAMLSSCRRLPLVAPFQVMNLKSLVESVANDFFANLYYLRDNQSDNNPSKFINLYNELLVRLKQAVSEEDAATKYNLAPQFVASIVACANAEDNLSSKRVPSIIQRYSLIGFTKWPPRSTSKLTTLLTKYCNALDVDGTLLPSVIRLVNPMEDKPVERICGEAPWLKVVELWFRFNVNLVSKKENAEKVFIFYDEKKISRVVESLCILNCKDI